MVGILPDPAKGSFGMLYSIEFWCGDRVIASYQSKIETVEEINAAGVRAFFQLVAEQPRVLRDVALNWKAVRDM